MERISQRKFQTWVWSINCLALLIAFVVGVTQGDLGLFFEEQMPITWLSTFQLWVIAFVCFKIYRTRKIITPIEPQKALPLIWAIIAAGFVFLGFDEILQIHENIDKYGHRLLNVKETALTDRIDDLIVGLYGVAGLLFLYWAKLELKIFWKVWSTLLVGFCLFLLMVVLDVITNRPDIITNTTLFELLAALEDSLKLLIEGIILVAVYRCYLMSSAQPS